MVGKVVAFMVFTTVAGFAAAFALLEHAYPGFMGTWFSMITGLESLTW